jgi:putative ABC transport system permease protein
MVESIWLDIQHAVRTLRASPLFTAIAVLSLSVGIAGTTVIFGVIDAYLLRPRPGIADPGRLVEVGRTVTGEGREEDPFTSAAVFSTFSYPNYRDYRERQTVFTELAASRTGVTFGISVDGRASSVSGAYTSANFFSVLGVRIALGRGFLPQEESPSSPATVVVISDRLWRTQFDADRDVVGRTIRLNGRPFSVIGVTAAGFNGQGIDRDSLWIPLTAYPDGDDLRRFERRGQQWLMGIGRLKPGVTVTQSQEQMSRIAADLVREYPDNNEGHGLAVASLGTIPPDGRRVVSLFLSLLFAFVGLILLIACSNVGAMVLSRGVSRSREIALRLALGAERGRLVRLLLTESVVVAAGATVVALAAAWVGLRLLERLTPMARFDVAYDVGVDWRVTAFSIAIATLSGMACGVLPALHAARVDLASAIAKDAGAAPRRLRLRQLFVVAQVAMSVLLVVCALLLTRSLRNADAIDPGFVPDGVEVVGLNLQLGGYDRTSGPVFAESLMSRIEALPAVETAALARVVPLTMETEGGRVWRAEDFGDELAISVSRNFVTPGYFRTISMPLVSGRNFDARDRAGAPAVVIVNETFAQRVWPGQDAVGQRLVLGVSRWPMEVVGVARDAKYRTIGERQQPFLFHPAAQAYEHIMWLLVRPRGPSAVPEVRALIQQMNPNLPVLRAATLPEMTAFTLLPQRLASWLAASMAFIGVFLASIGIYGLVAYNVGQRTREIGIRMALGALRSQIIRMVMSGAALLAGIGVGLGLLAASLATSLLAGMLYGIEPLDPVSFAGSTAVFVAVVALASLVPARRAASVNPVAALRAE